MILFTRVGISIEFQEKKKIVVYTVYEKKIDCRGIDAMYSRTVKHSLNIL